MHDKFFSWKKTGSGSELHLTTLGFLFDFYLYNLQLFRASFGKQLQWGMVNASDLSLVSLRSQGFP